MEINPCFRCKSNIVRYQHRDYLGGYIKCSVCGLEGPFLRNSEFGPHDPFAVFRAWNEMGEKYVNETAS